MGYLEQFAKSSRAKDTTEVLTARIPESLYMNFRDYCDDLGLSISEAVYLLVKLEMTGFDEKTQDDEPTLYTNEYNSNDDEHKKNHSVVETCPICGEWISSSKFSRHSKQHGSNTYSIFTNETYLIKVNEMIQEEQTHLVK